LFKFCFGSSKKSFAQQKSIHQKIKLMKTKNLLSPVVLMLIALAVTAQNATNKQHSVKDIIPFGKKLPVPDLSKYPGRPLPGITRPGTNTALMQGINSLNANMIKKDPDYYRQQLLKSRATSVESFQRNSTLAAEEGNRSCPTSDFHLTKDINALKESNPHNYIDFHVNTSFAILDDVIYFAAEDGAHGMELWRSDGTAAGTYMVKDIEPGEGSSLSYAANITVVKGKIYFSAFTTAYGWEPWTSDGTENSTHLLMDIKPGELWSWAGQFFGIGSTVYFVTDGDFSSWGALWKTDGTKAGTKLVKNIGDEGSGGFLISQLTAVNGLLFFTFLNFNSNSWELWRSDGTDAGTYHIGTSIFFLDIPAQLTNYNSKLYFSSNDGSGRKLWVSDGTDAGTTPAPSNHDILIDADYLGITFPVLNNALYIPGLTTSKGWGLYKYDASDAAGLIKIKDLAPGLDPAFIVPSEMVVIKNTLYFKVTNYNGSLHDELWSSKGTNVTTQILKTFLSGETIYSLYNGNGILYSVKHEAVYGSELFKTNGSGDDITLVSDIFKGVTSSYPAYLTAFKGKLLFSAADELKGNELFMTDGTDKSTALVKDINTVSTSSSYPGSLTALGHDVLFTAYERVHGDELYKSDGTS